MNYICKHCGSENTAKNGKKIGGTVQQIYCKDCGRSSSVKIGEEQEQPAAKPINQGISEAQLRAKHDNKYKVNAAVRKLKPGNFIPESEFLRLADIKPGAGYRTAIDAEEFQKYKGKAGGVIYWSSMDSILKLKNEGVLQ